MSLVIVMLTNILIRCSFIAAMCYCLHTGHTVFALLSLVGALLCGYNITTKNRKDNLYD